MALNSALSNNDMTVKRKAADEVLGRSTDAASKAAGTISTWAANNKSNPMTQRAAVPAGTVRQFGNTTTSGEGQVMMNGQMVGASNPQGGSYLGNMADVTGGLGNVKSGYKSGNIGLNESTGLLTYNGKDMGIKASDYAGGVNDSNVSSIADGYTNATGDAVMRGRDYVNSKGLGELVSWDDATKTMSVGGINVPYHYITADGNAMVSRSVLDGVLAQVQKNMGIQSGTDLTQSIYDKYNPTISDLTDKVINRDAWEYDPRNDPAYQAYAKEYQRNAEQMYNRAMGSGGLYGSPSSYQQYQALAGYGDSMSQLSDAVPTLAAMDYQRYADEAARNQAALEAMQRERAYEYDMLYGANENQIDRAKASDETNYSRRYDSMYRYPLSENELSMSNNELSMSNVDAAMYPLFKDIEMQIQQGNLNSVTLQNDIAILDKIAYEAQLNGGEFTAEHKAYLGLPENSTVNLHTSGIKQALQMYYQAQKPIALDSMKYGIG